MSLLLAAALAAVMAACSEAPSSPSPTPTATPGDEPTPPVEATPTAVPSAIVLTWTREGGIAGFCDGLLISAGHLASLGTCEDPGSALPSGELMPNATIREFEEWRSEFASFEVEWADGPGVADGMTIRLSFTGRGRQVADEDAQRRIAEFASRLLADLAAAQPRAAAH